MPRRGSIRRRAGALVAAATMVAVTATSVAAALPAAAAAPPAGAPQPYHDPPYSCVVHDYGQRPPTLPAPADDPLCVRYDKRNITIGDLGVVDFLRAEPGRVAVLAGKCAYWQQDRWEVRLLPFGAPLIEWSGSYWFDGRTLTAGAVMRGLKVGGQPVAGSRFVEVMRALFGSQVADRIAPYVDANGGGGVSYDVPDAGGLAPAVHAVCGPGR